MTRPVLTQDPTFMRGV